MWWERSLPQMFYFISSSFFKKEAPENRNTRSVAHLRSDIIFKTNFIHCPLLVQFPKNSLQFHWNNYFKKMKNKTFGQTFRTGFGRKTVCPKMYTHQYLCIYLFERQSEQQKEKQPVKWPSLGRGTCRWWLSETTTSAFHFLRPLPPSARSKNIFEEKNMKNFIRFHDYWKSITFALRHNPMKFQIN